jgi:hypothetical protein
MLIRTFDSAKSLEDNKLKDCGIIKYKRDICILVNPEEYENNTTRRGKAVIINQSVSKGNKEGNLVHVAVDNSLLVRCSVYFCDVLFEVANNIGLSQFTVENGYSKEYQSLFDSNVTATYLPGNYSNILSRIEDYNPELYSDIITNVDTAVIPPIFYNEVQQYKLTQDIFCMGGTVSEVYSGRDLIDNNTKISFLNINFWDTVRFKVLGIMSSVEENSSETFNVANLLYHDFSHFVGEGATFIYDSDGKGQGIGGMNIVGGDIPLKQYFTKSFIPNNVDSALILFEHTCHDIEKSYGSVKIQCRPSKIGNKIKIRLKDYKSFPSDFSPLGLIGPDGGSSSVDTSYNIEKEMNELIEMSGTQF